VPYWSFITALTIGYGDIRPDKKSTRILSVIIGMLGIMFTGIIVAATTKALKTVVGLE
jgi:voltage-gated potassium channel